MSFNSVLSQFNSVHVGNADISGNSIHYYTPDSFNSYFRIYLADAIMEAKKLFICLFIFSRCISIDNLSVHLYECVYYTTGQNFKPESYYVDQIIQSYFTKRKWFTNEISFEEKRKRILILNI
jgi:hypothetical protein